MIPTAQYAEVSELLGRERNDWSWAEWVRAKDALTLAVVGQLSDRHGWVTIPLVLERLREVGAPNLAWQDSQTVRNTLMRLARHGHLLTSRDERGNMRWTIE